MSTSSVDDSFVDFSGHLKRKLSMGSKRDCANCSKQKERKGKQIQWE